MPFDPNANHLISLSVAQKLTANYRAGSPTNPVAHAYGKKQMIQLLEQQDCEGFRIYYGLNDAGGKELVIVGVDENGNDLYEGKI